MKWVLIISLLVGGEPVEVSRTSPGHYLPTKEICTLAGKIALAKVYEKRPDWIGRVLITCVKDVQS